MIIVKAMLASAVTGRTTDLGTLHIANVGGTRTRGKYEGRAYRKNAPVAQGLQEAGSTRRGRVEGYGRLAEPAWTLVASMLRSMGYSERHGHPMMGEAVDEVPETLAEELVSAFEEAVEDRAVDRNADGLLAQCRPSEQTEASVRTAREALMSALTDGVPARSRTPTDRDHLEEIRRLVRQYGNWDHEVGGSLTKIQDHVDAMLKGEV